MHRARRCEVLLRRALAHPFIESYCPHYAPISNMWRKCGMQTAKQAYSSDHPSLPGCIVSSEVKVQGQQVRRIVTAVCRAMLIPASVLLAPFSLAQSPASNTLPEQHRDAGVSESGGQDWHREAERQKALREQQEKVPDVRLEAPRAGTKDVLPRDEVPCFRIDEIVLEGDLSERFVWALKAADPADDPATGQCLGVAGVKLVIKRVQNAIMQKGFITTRIVTSPQDLTSGKLRLTVIPGRLKARYFSDDSAGRSTLWNALPVRSGDLLNLRDIEQGLENFKRLPTVDVKIQIKPSEDPDAGPGDSDLLIQRQQRFPFRIGISLNDAGSESTGKYQGSITLSHDNWWALNDLFYVNFNRALGEGKSSTRGSEAYFVHYEIPYGYWLLGASYGSSEFEHRVTGYRGQGFLYKGSGENGEVRLSRLLYRDAVRKTSAYLRGWTRASSNLYGDIELAYQRRRMAGWEIGLTHHELIGRASLNAGISYRRGTGALSALPAAEEASKTGTSRPAIVNADARLNIPFSIAAQRMRYTTTWRAQWNRTPLIMQDHFTIGSRYTVRGFDGERWLGGDRGWLVRNDVGMALGRTSNELYLGLDHGEVSGQATRTLKGRRLTGAVLGLRGEYKGAYWEGFIARPLAKPDDFETAAIASGFQLSWSY